VILKRSEVLMRRTDACGSLETIAGRFCARNPEPLTSIKTLSSSPPDKNK